MAIYLAPTRFVMRRPARYMKANYRRIRGGRVPSIGTHHSAIYTVDDYLFPVGT